MEGKRMTKIAGGIDGVSAEVVADIRELESVWEEHRRTLAYWEETEFRGKRQRPAPAFLFDNWRALNYEHRVSALSFFARVFPRKFDALISYVTGAKPKATIAKMVAAQVAADRRP